MLSETRNCNVFNCNWLSLANAIELQLQLPPSFVLICNWFTIQVNTKEHEYKVNETIGVLQAIVMH